MNPDSKLLLDEMHHLFNEQKTQSRTGSLRLIGS